MTETAERMKRQLLGFSLRDRAELAHFLIESLDEGHDSDAEPAWDEELSRRLKDIENGQHWGNANGSLEVQKPPRIDTVVKSTCQT